MLADTSSSSSSARHPLLINSDSTQTDEVSSTRSFLGDYGTVEKVESAASSSFSLYRCMGTAANETWMFARKYSGVVTEISILLLDILFLYGTEASDEELAAWSYMMLGLIGLLYYPYYGHELHKRAHDLMLAWQVDEKLITAASALRMIDTANSIGLTAASAIAGISNTVGDSELMEEIFTATVPWGEIALAFGLGVRVLTIAIDWRTLKRLREQFSESDYSVIAHTLIDNLSNMDTPESDSSQVADLKKLASRIRACMDKDTLHTFLEAIRDPESGGDTTHVVALMEQASENIQIQLRITQGGYLVVTVVGYGLLAVERANPYTSTAAICNLSGLGINVLWQLIDKGKEILNRRRIRKIADSSTSH